MGILIYVLAAVYANSGIYLALKKNSENSPEKRKSGYVGLIPDIAHLPLLNLIRAVLGLAFFPGWFLAKKRGFYLPSGKPVETRTPELAAAEAEVEQVIDPSYENLEGNSHQNGQIDHPAITTGGFNNQVPRV